jgi:transcription factor IIIB 90 kDa subunit
MKLLKRMKMDWMAHGRRPNSLCGAAILIAARSHGFKNITVREVAQKVLVCEETLRKRLEEFKETKTAKLTYEEFAAIDIEKIGSEMDPPAFKNRKMSIK